MYSLNKWKTLHELCVFFLNVFTIFNSKLEQKDDSSDDETWLVEDTTNEGDGKIYEGDDDDSDSDGDKYDMMTLNWDPATDKR